VPKIFNIRADIKFTDSIPILASSSEEAIEEFISYFMTNLNNNSVTISNVKVTAEDVR
jgi:hypothetical protein